MLQLRSDSLAATSAIAASLAGLARRGRPHRARRRDGSRQDGVRQGLRRGDRRHRADHLADLHPGAQLSGRPGDAAPRRHLPPDDASRGRRPGARRAARVRRDRDGRVGRRRRRIAGRPRAGAARVRRGRRRGPRHRDQRRGPGVGSALGRDRTPTGGASHADPRHRDRDRAGQRRHRRPRGCAGDVRGVPRPPPRRDADPVDRVRVQAGRHRDVGVRRDRGRRRPGSVHRHARRARRGQGHRPGAARADDRDQLARPAGVPAAPEWPRGRRRDRRSQGRAVLRVLSAGARRRAAARRAAVRIGRRPDRRVDGARARHASASATARCATATRSPLSCAATSPSSSCRILRPRRWCSWRTPARCARSGSTRGRSSRCTCALPTRRSTGRPGHRHREVDDERAVAAAGARRCRRRIWSIEPMRRRHLADVLAIEQVSYPKPWSRGVFQSELELPARGERTTSSPAPARWSSATPG